MNIAFLPVAGWDLVSFLENGGNYAQLVGGALLILLGAVGIVWGGVLAIRKLMGGQRNDDSWLKIAALIIVGGAFLTGGWAFIALVASGGQQTVEDLGGGTVLLSLLGL